jgi:hypothetical protein
MPVEPAPGGDSYAEPVALRVLDIDNAAYVKGVWEGYRTALAWAQKDAAANMPTANQWQGDRAERFHSWWGGANADLDSLATGISSVILALEEFIMSASWVNAPLANVEYLVRTNCDHYLPIPEQNQISGMFVPKGGTSPDAEVWISGITMKVMGAFDWPPWLRQVQALLATAAQTFQQASDSANEYLRGAMTAFTSMRQFKHLGRSNTSGDGPFADDPTWQALTGGGVFRMPLSGFTTDPFGTRLMPAWYDPTTSQKVSAWIGANEWVFDVGAFVLAVAGQPEAAVGLEVLVHGTKLALDATDGDTGEIPWDAVDLILDVPGALSLDDLADALTQDVVYQARHAAGGSIPKAIKGSLSSLGYQAQHAGETSPEVLAALRDFVAARLSQSIQQQVSADGTTYTVLPASALKEVAAEAAGEYETLMAAHVPPALAASSLKSSGG